MGAAIMGVSVTATAASTRATGANAIAMDETARATDVTASGSNATVTNATGMHVSAMDSGRAKGTAGAALLTHADARTPERIMRRAERCMVVWVARYGLTNAKTCPFTRAPMAATQRRCRHRLLRLK